MKEYRVAYTSYDQLQGSPFTLNPSPDGTMLVFGDGYAWYLTKIN